MTELGMITALALFAASAILFQGAVAVSTSKLQILIPQELSKPGDGYDHRDALFGIPPYGGSIQQQVYYSATTMCRSQVDPKHGYPPSREWKSPFILMVDRGECTFVQKVRNAQRVGASAVLIADDICLCDHDNCELDIENGEICEAEEPIMADDGSGSDISIPSFLVFKEDADAIKASMMQEVRVRAQMSFKVPAPDSRVEYDLWTHPSDPNSRPIEETWPVAALALGEHASFTPHHYVYDGKRAGCQNELGVNQCYNLCTNSGLYCSTDPDEDLDNGASGADVVKESLRRICIWNLYGLKDGVGQPWWNYVTNFIENCDNFTPPYDPKKSKFNDAQCVSEAMKAAEIDEDMVETCMINSGGVGPDLNATNHLLEKEIADQEALGVVLIPSLLVNKAVVRGSLSFATVLRAVCSGFSQGSEPDICLECANCHDELKCVQDNGKCPSKNSGGGDGVPIHIFASILVILLCCFLLAAYIQHRRQERQMRDEIRGIVQEYMPVSVAAARGGTSMGIPQDEDDVLDANDGDDAANTSSFSIT